MGNGMHTFEVRVEVKQRGSRHFSSHVGAYIETTVTKMFHIDARTRKQAMQRVEKHGRPISGRKVDFEKMGGNIELLLERDSKLINPYPDAVAMDEFIWKKKNKRVERINDRARDKNNH